PQERRAPHPPHHPSPRRHAAHRLQRRPRNSAIDTQASGHRAERTPCPGVRPLILRTTRTSLCLFVLLLTAAARPSRAQSSEHTMSEAEVERLRESAYIPSDRVAEFVKI